MILRRVPRIFVTSLTLSMLAVPASSQDRIGLDAFAKLVAISESSNYQLSIDELVRLREINFENDTVYFMDSGYEIYTQADPPIMLSYSVLGINELVFDRDFPTSSEYSPLVLLANIPVIPESHGAILRFLVENDDLQLHTKVAITLALRWSVAFESETIELLSEQLAESEGALREATYLALLPVGQALQYTFIQPHDLYPVLEAFETILDESPTARDALMIEAILASRPFLVASVRLPFANQSLPDLIESLVMRSSIVPARTDLEQAARSHFRSMLMVTG